MSVSSLACPRCGRTTYPHLCEPLMSAPRQIATRIVTRGRILYGNLVEYPPHRLPARLPERSGEK